MGSTAVLWHRDGAHAQMEKIDFLKLVNGIHSTKNTSKPHDTTRPQPTSTKISRREGNIPAAKEGWKAKLYISSWPLRRPSFVAPNQNHFLLYRPRLAAHHSVLFVNLLPTGPHQILYW